MKTVFLTILATLSFNTFAQSLECQMMRDEILSQSKAQQQQRQQQQQQQQQQALAYAQMDNMQRAQMSIYQGGAGLGQALSGIGQPSLQEKIKIYKQRCE
jgi:hypothetical protein